MNACANALGWFFDGLYVATGLVVIALGLYVIRTKR